MSSIRRINFFQIIRHYEERSNLTQKDKKCAISSKNRLKSSSFLLTTFILITQVGFTQNVKEDILKINNAYATTPFISMSVTYSYYLDKDKKEPAKIRRGQFKKNHENVFSTIETTKTIQNKRYMFVIDKESKMIIVSKPKIEFGIPMAEDLDTMLAKCSEIDFSKPTKNEYQYKFIFKNAGEYESIDIRYNKKTYLITKVALNFKNAMPIDVNDEDSPKKIPKVEITYTNINATNPIPESYFSEKPYFYKKNGEFMGSLKYKEYSLINNIITR